jgi:Subtilase family
MAKKKYLPIKIVEKRKEIDDSLTEGGGGDDPLWMLNVPLEERAEMIFTTLGEVGNELDKRVNKNNFIPVTVEIKLDEKTLAKTHRSHIRKMIDVNQKNNLIGFFDESSLLVKIENSKDLHAIENNVSNLKKNMHGLASIVGTNLFEPKIEVENNDYLKVKLIDFQESELNKTLHRAFQKTCKELNLEFEGDNYSDDLIIYKIPYNEKAMPVLQSFEGLSSIEDMPTYNITFDSESTEVDDFVEAKEPNENKNYPIVGILDSGIAENKCLSPWILKDKHTNYVDDDIDTGHGTAVASVIVYGDKLEGSDYTNADGCFLYDATIVPKQDLLNTVTEFDLRKNIEEAIKNRPEIKVWNLCVGWSNEIDSHKISDFGAALDSIQDENNVIICTSVGNCDNFKINKPKGKIQKSADSVRALAVGSIAHKQDAHDISKEDEPSPFSRMGSGPFDLVKPELTHYGGNSGVNDEGQSTFSGVNTINAKDEVSPKAGTSFSTPRVTSIMAGLLNELAEDFDPLLLKTLMIHSAKYPAVTLDLEDRLKQMGFGVPSNITNILYNAENEITLVIRDTLDKGNFIEILDFPYPENMVEGNFYYGEITATLVSSPDLDATQGDEYCQSNIDVYFGTYNEKVERKGRTIRNSIGKDKLNQNLFAPGIYSKREIIKNSNFSGERILKSYHQKYQPVKKWAVDLDDITETNKIRYTEYPKRWFLKIEGLYRDHLEKTQENISTDFCLVITIKDTKKNTKVYDNITAGLEANNFVQNSIKIKTDIQLKN